MPLARRIIPCLDVKHGRVVKGVRFVQLRDSGDPVACAQRYDEEGADEIVFLDITATSDERPILLDIVKKTADVVFAPLTVGGGVRSLEDAHALLRAGADKIAVNSAAVQNPRLIENLSEHFGRQAIVVAIDARRFEPHRASPTDSLTDIQSTCQQLATWEVVTHGGRKSTQLSALDWAQEVCRLGAGEILLTSMDRDGTMAGYDLELTRTIAKAVSIPVIASGGVGTLDHLVDGLTLGGADAVLAASIFHDGRYTIAEAKAHLAKVGVPVRLQRV